MTFGLTFRGGKPEQSADAFNGDVHLTVYGRSESGPRDCSLRAGDFPEQDLGEYQASHFYDGRHDKTK